MTKLVSISWWFTIVISLLGLFPAFGSLLKGVVKLAFKALADIARPGLDVFLRVVGSAPAVLADALQLASELLAKVDSWRPQVIAKFHEITDMLIDGFSSLPSALASKAASVLEFLRGLKQLAVDLLPEGIKELLKRLPAALDGLKKRLGEAAPSVEKKFAKELEQKKTEATQALKGVATGTHQGLAIKKTLKAMEDLKLVDDVTLQAVTNMGNAVVDAFNIPENFVEAMLTLEKQRLALAGAGDKVEFDHLDELLKTAPDLRTKLSPKAAEYIAAVRALAGNRSVVEIHRTGPSSVLIVHRNPAGVITSSTPVDNAVGGFVPNDVFMSEVIAPGEVILDFAALELSKEGSHGALSHFLQELVADKALQEKGLGTTAQFRGLMNQIQESFRQVTAQGELVDPEFIMTDPLTLQPVVQSFKPGTIMWVGLFDRLSSLAQPETLWPPLRIVLDWGPRSCSSDVRDQARPADTTTATPRPRNQLDLGAGSTRTTSPLRTSPLGSVSTSTTSPAASSSRTARAWVIPTTSATAIRLAPPFGAMSSRNHWTNCPPGTSSSVGSTIRVRVPLSPSPPRTSVRAWQFTCRSGSFAPTIAQPSITKRPMRSAVHLFSSSTIGSWFSTHEAESSPGRQLSSLSSTSANPASSTVRVATGRSDQIDFSAARG